MALRQLCSNFPTGLLTLTMVIQISIKIMERKARKDDFYGSVRSFGAMKIKEIGVSFPSSVGVRLYEMNKWKEWGEIWCLVLTTDPILPIVEIDPVYWDAVQVVTRSDDVRLFMRWKISVHPENEYCKRRFA